MEDIKTIISDSALASRRVNLNERRNNKPWFTQDLEEWTTRKNVAYLKYKAVQMMEQYNEDEEVRNKTN